MISHLDRGIYMAEFDDNFHHIWGEWHHKRERECCRGNVYRCLVRLAWNSGSHRHHSTTVLCTSDVYWEDIQLNILTVNLPYLIT